MTESNANSTPTVALAWATRKRHIAIDGVVLCNPAPSTGYSGGNGCYNSLGLGGIPSYSKKSDDVRYSHGDGIIAFLPLDQQPTKIVTRSICKKCLQRFDTRLVKAGISNRVKS